MTGCAGQDTTRPRLQLCGTWRLRRYGNAVPVRPNEQRLLALLALRGSQPRTQLSGMLWPESSEAQATASLRSAIWRLRRSIPWTLSLARSDLGLGDDLAVDAVELRRAARALIDGSDPTSDAAAWHAELLVQAGELLAGWFDDWALIERERFRQLRVHALEAHAARLATRHRYAEALDAAFTALAAEPFRESSHQLIARIHLTEGNLSEAIRAYQLYHRLLGEELIQQSQQARQAPSRPTITDIQHWLTGY